MIVLKVIGGVIIVAVALAAWYDHRARRHRWRTGVSAKEALQNRMDVEAIESPLSQGETKDWMTWRRRDQKERVLPTEKVGRKGKISRTGLAADGSIAE